MESSWLKQVFENLYGKPLSGQELFDIERNLKGFFDLLIKIDQRDKKGKGNEQDNGSPNKNC